MNYIEIIITQVLDGKEFRDSFQVFNNIKYLYESKTLDGAFEWLKANGLYSDYLLSCEN